MGRGRNAAVLGTSAIVLIGTLGVSWLSPWTVRAANQTLTGGWAVLDQATAKKLGRHWEDGWNRRDLATIMDVFAKDVVFSSPAVPRGTGDPKQTTIRGYDALNKYIAHSLSQPSSGGRYTLDATYSGTDSVILQYSCRDAKGKVTCRGSDSFRVGPDGKVVEWRCHYTVGPGDEDLIKSER